MLTIFHMEEESLCPKGCSVLIISSDLPDGMTMMMRGTKMYSRYSNYANILGCCRGKLTWICAFLFLYTKVSKWSCMLCRHNDDIVLSGSIIPAFYLFISRNCYNTLINSHLYFVHFH
jgi:hypothetical protein